MLFSTKIIEKIEKLFKEKEVIALLLSEGDLLLIQQNKLESYFHNWIDLEVRYMPYTKAKLKMVKMFLK